MSTTNEIRLPQSMAYYLANDKNKQAIESLLASKKPPADMTWDELENYYQARMAAEQVRFDHWCLCKKIWLNTWGRVGIEDNLKISKIQTGWEDGEFSQEKVWEDGGIYHYFKKNGKYPEIYFFISVYCGSMEIKLGFYAVDEKSGYDISNELTTLGSDWEVDPDDNDRITIPGLAKLSADAGAIIDLTKLQKAAESAITELAKII